MTKNYHPVLTTTIAFTIVGALLLCLCPSGSLLAQSNEISPEIKTLLNIYEKKICFTENKGQWPEQIRFKAQFSSGQALATSEGILVGTYDPEGLSKRYDKGMREEQAEHDGLPFNEPAISVKGHGWLMNFVDHSPDMSIESKTRHPEVFNYFQGDPDAWRTDVGNFQEIWYRNVYDHVDVRFYPALDGSLEYDLICMPGFNKDKLILQFDGISSIKKQSNGALVLETSVGDMVLPAPIAYQKTDGLKHRVYSSYKVTGNNTIQFELMDFDPSSPLIIDPIALRWATWINSESSGDNHGHCIWVDPADGAIYIANRVQGTTNNITVGAFNDTSNGDIETVIGKYYEPATIGGAGTRVWQTYIGGISSDNPYAMEQGPDGNLYITGATNSYNYPLLGGPAFSGSSIDNRSEFNNNIFVLKINQAGNSIKSAVVGGDGNDGSYDLRINAAGDVFITGRTNSNNLATLHPGSGAVDSSQGSSDIFLFKLNQDLSSIEWMKNYGGSGDDQSFIMKMNSVNGDIFLGGVTNSSDFPTLNARESSAGGFRNGFLQKLESNGTLVWSSYFNSDTNGQTSILCMEFNTQQNKLYFGGTTRGLSQNNTSLSGVYNNIYSGGNNDLFVAVMDTGQNFIASTYIGGSNNEGNMMGLNLDLNNDVYIFGYSNSNDFPVTGDALQDTNHGNNDKVFLKLSSSLSNLTYSTYYGGIQDDYDPIGERGIKFSNCRIYTLVTARSPGIPLTEGAITTTKLSQPFTYEPGLVVWANPPDLSGNALAGNQQLCQGVIPGDVTGSSPAYILPNISRNDTVSPYPGLGFSISYQWQSSTDSVNWTNIPGATGQNLSGPVIGPMFHKTFFRRVIGGDACVIVGETNQIIVLSILSILDTITNSSCLGTDDASVIATALNGVPPYSYVWDNGATTSSIHDLSPGAYTLTVTDAMSCSNSGSYIITEPAALNVACSSQGTFCNSSSGSITSSVTGGTAPYSWLWSNGENTDSISGLADGTYSVEITDAHGCTVQSVPIDILVADQLVLTLSVTGPVELCEGDSALLAASAQDTVSWQWYRDGIAIPGATGPTLSVTDLADYTVMATGGNGCTGTSDEIEVLVSDIPDAWAGPDEFICPGESVTLSASGGESFLWNNGATTSSITVTPGQAGDYWVSIGNPYCGLESSDTVYVSIADLPIAAIGVSGNPSLGNPVGFNDLSGDSSIISWTWNFGDGSSSGQQNPHHTYDSENPFTIILTVENQYGCFNNDTLDVDITQSILIPNVLTPNSDGANDALSIPNNGVDGYDLVIFNRWGLTVFEDHAKELFWDGKTDSGVLLSEGTYFYILNVSNEGSIGDFRQKGFITLVR